MKPANDNETDKERLQKLVRLLFSTMAAGEVVSARDAILRTSRPMAWTCTTWPKRLPTAWPARSILQEPSEDASARDIAKWCLREFERKGVDSDNREYVFLEGIADFWRREPTPKQAKWVSDIYARCRRSYRASQRAAA